MISLPSLIISYKRSDELNKICNKIFEEKEIEECKIYLDHADNIEDENKSRFNFIVDFSGLNIKNYRIIHAILTENGCLLLLLKKFQEKQNLFLELIFYCVLK